MTMKTKLLALCALALLGCADEQEPPPVNPWGPVAEALMKAPIYGADRPPYYAGMAIDTCQRDRHFLSCMAGMTSHDGTVSETTKACGDVAHGFAWRDPELIKPECRQTKPPKSAAQVWGEAQPKDGSNTWMLDRCEWVTMGDWSVLNCPPPEDMPEMPERMFPENGKGIRSEVY
jgi:hypothetical protein